MITWEEEGTWKGGQKGEGGEWRACGAGRGENQGLLGLVGIFIVSYKVSKIDEKPETWKTMSATGMYAAQKAARKLSLGKYKGTRETIARLRYLGEYNHG